MSWMNENRMARPTFGFYAVKHRSARYQKKEKEHNIWIRWKNSFVWHISRHRLANWIDFVDLEFKFDTSEVYYWFCLWQNKFLVNDLVKFSNIKMSNRVAFSSGFNFSKQSFTSWKWSFSEIFTQFQLLIEERE